VIHARSGGAYEIMGLMQGKVVNRTFCVMDSFALPVQGTETRVNAQEEASGYMIEHMEGSKNVSQPILLAQGSVGKEGLHSQQD
jgi:COP9 signalosome complex subunit 5